MDEVIPLMEKDMRDVPTLQRCITDLLHAAETEKNVDNFQKALQTVGNALKTNQKNEPFVQTVINFYQRIIEMRQCRSLVESSSIHAHLINLLSTVKDKSPFSAPALSLILKTMEIPRICPYYSNSQLINILVYIARINSKSFKHTKRISKIAKHLDSRLGTEYKDLCAVLVLISRSTPVNDPKQQYFISAFSHICNEKILAEVGNLAVPLYTDVCMNQSNNFQMAKCLFNIASKCTSDQFDMQILQLIEYQMRRIKEDSEALKSVITILANKNDPKKTPASVVSIAYTAMQVFIADKKTVEDCLTVCFRGLAASSDPVKVSPSLATTVTSIISMYNRDKGIIRRCAAILHTLSADPDNDASLMYSSVPQTITQTISANTDDKHTIVICSSALSNVISDNSILAAQINTGENVNLFKSIARKYRTKSNIIKNIMMILHSIMLTEYQFREFIDLTDEPKQKYQIDNRYVLDSLKELSDDQAFVRACLAHMTYSSKNQELISNLMLKYTHDSDIVYAAFSHNIKDISAINRGLMSLHESGLRFVYKTLLHTEDPLPTQTIGFLLSLDRPDAIQILFAQLKKGSDSIIASQLQLSYISQIPLAKELYDKSLWQPTEENAQIILSAIAFSRFDQERLSCALFLAQHIGLSKASYPLLLDFINNFPQNEDIVSICASFLNVLPIDKEFINLSVQYNVVQRMACAMDQQFANEPTVYLILTFIAQISSIQQLYAQFYEPVILMKLANISVISDRCAIEVSRIFSNLSRSHVIIDILVKLNAMSIAFKHFGPDSYQLVHSILLSGSQTLTNNQIEIISKEFNSRIASVSMDDAISLIKLVLDLLETGIELQEMPSTRTLSQLYSMYSSEPEVLQILSRLTIYVDEFYEDDELIFAIMNALKINIKNFQTVFKLVTILSHVPHGNDKPVVFESQSVIQALVDVLDEYYDDSSICTPILKLLLRHKEAFESAMKALVPDKSDEDLTVIAQYLLSIGANDYGKTVSRVFDVMRSHSNNFDIITCLSPVIYFAADSEQSHKIIINNMQLLLDSSIRFLNSNRLSRALPATICRLSENPDLIPRLDNTPPYITMIMKAWPLDSQIIQASTGLMINFANADRAELFSSALPLIASGLKQIELVSYMCEAVTALVYIVGNYGFAIADTLFDLLINKIVLDGNNSEEDTEEISNLRVLISDTLCALTQPEENEDIIYNKIDDALSLIEKSDEQDELRINLLKFLANVHDKNKVDKFQPYMENLMVLLEGKKIGVGTAAGQVILRLTSLKPSLGDPYLNRVMAVAKQSASEQYRVCIAIKDQIYGIKMPTRA